ncbi:PH domain-containing protein [Candidatus Peregrinibacteria bacterium]|nr:PH domain-containing protein [Candidatus Peregrinibacteria bacterium]
MQLREGEQINSTFRRHLLPTVLKLITVALGSAPFYLLVYFLRNDMSAGGLFAAITAVTAVFGLFLLHILIDDRLDRLVITNQRIVFIDWKMVIFKTESDIDIKDIQEVSVTEKGILSKFRLFDFGRCIIETASPDVSITFDHAAHPAEIRDLILSLKKV